MTGYGRARETRSGRDITVEVRSVNNRYLDCAVKMPRAYIFAEDAVKTRVQKAVSRGKVDGFITIDTSAADEAVVKLNRPLAQGYYKALCEINEACGLESEITASTIARFPDVLTVTKAEPSTEEDAVEGQIHIEADESAVMHFAATPEVDSKLYDVPHIFELVPEGDGWLIKHHEADDNPYFSLTYQEGTEEDGRLQQLLRAIERRQLQRQETVQVTLTCDHPYDRAAAEQYMRQYDHQRSSAWHAYDDVGGNCMNFGSQVLLAGGIPMDEQGGSKWYWYGQNSLDLSWINVVRFYSYARENEGYGLVADTEANYYTGEVGDILILGPDGGHNHTTVISGIIRDEAGQTVDYLLCSNTTNYTDFPAGAYYYTSQRLIKIYGWNDMPVE